MTSSVHRVEYLIIGGGIGGLATALALGNAGLPVHVIEQAEEFTEIGAGIQLAPNALSVLDDLGTLDAVMRTAVRPPQAVLMSAVAGEPLISLNFNDAFVAEYGYPYIVTHRSDLLAALLDACLRHNLITLENGKEIVDIFPADGVAVCADGASYSADAIIGADGVWSTVRQRIVGDDKPRYVGHVGYRGTVPIEAISDRIGKENVTWWVGPGMHLIQYPVRGGKLFNQVAVFNVDQAPDNPEDWGPPEELDRVFANTSPHVREGVRLLHRDRRWVLRDRAPVDNWTDGRVTLLGDAAHPMVQYLAQGACQALEDAVVLARCLVKSRPNIESAFTEYQRLRIPRTATAQRWGRSMGQIVHAQGLMAGLRDELFAADAAAGNAYVDWLYRYDSRNPEDGYEFVMS